ncbi:tandem-95 repeat protein [Buttiauxella sp. 3AFRM03]|uniref:Ig-like domain-containing protein n=1 Tax=Buttiauxella sp. 3AFRM03 TaxID=2479367 RepID=UPI000EF82AE4|nr:Ig-like domain-containing protein [Buttiauxella sp. 3AFRM03]AYN27949.1 tandem-95 repeat protein [Buttiauxella sp. 3AFRM03]
MSRPRNDNPTRPRHHRFALEPRQLFDGAAAVESANHADNPLDATHHDNAPDAAKAVFVPPAPVPAPASITAPAPTDAPAAHEVYVVDSHVQNWQSLVNQLPEGSRVVVLDAQHSGLEQINEALKNDKNITAIHIISHGASDEITLGSDKLNDQTITQYQQQLEKLGEKLTTDGDILLYGCNVTAQDTTLITRMADYTHADVAASSDETGSALKAADWTLESHTGVIETRSLELAYDGVLQAPELTTRVPDMVVSEPSVLHPGAETGSFSGLTLNVSDEKVAISVTLTNGAAGDLVNGSSAGKTLEFVGSVADAQAWLNALKFTASDSELGQQSATTDVQFYILTLSGNDSLVTHITVTPANDPVVVDNSTLIVPENNGAGTVITEATLAALDPELAAGAQSASQIVYSLTEMPQYGYLTLNGTRLGVGSVFTQQDVRDNKLVYVHTATGSAQNTADSFTAKVNDGATPINLSDTVKVTLEIAPENQPPTVSGGGIVFEGQPANAANTGNVGQYIVADGGGDTQDGELTLTITALPTHGTLYFNGVAVIQGQQISYNDRNLLTYENNGEEGITQDTFGVRVTDQGGGTATPASSDALIALTIQPVDDDPALNPDSTLLADVADGPDSVVLMPEMLASIDEDSPPDRVSFVVNVDGLTHGYLTLNGARMQNGDTFTMEDVVEGRVVYTQYLNAPIDGIDKFSFRVIDHSTALRWNADGSTFTRQGGIWDSESPDAKLTHFDFTIGLVPLANNPPPDQVPPLDTSGDTTSSGYIGDDPNGAAHGIILEGGSLTLSGTGNISDATPGMSYVVPGVQPEQIVYTFLGSGSGQTGLTILKSDGNGGYTVINAFGTFTQADLNNGLISVRHDGGENFHFDGKFSVSAGQVTLDSTGNPMAVTWNPELKVFVTPVNDAPVIAGSSNTVLAEGETVIITNSQLQLGDPDDANSGSPWEDGPTINGNDNNYAYNNDLTGDRALKFAFLTLPTGGVLQYFNGTSWVTITDADIGTLKLDASLLKNDSTSGLRFVSNGSEVRSTSFVAYAVDRWGMQSATNATVGITITNVNDGPKIPQTPDSPEIVVPPDSPNNIGGQPANNPATVVEGSYVQINGSQLQAYDPDSSPEQVQFTITNSPDHGHLAFSRDGVNFSTIGNGSTFTQADINNGYIYYLNDGDEISGDGLNADGFDFTLSDGDKEQAANHFAINITPANDKPTVTAPSGPIDIGGNSHAVSGFTVADPDITGTSSATNILQTTVRLLHNDGSAFSQSEYNNIRLAANGASGALITGGDGGYLVITGTVAQINSALSGLTVTFPDDRNTVYQVQVITDDRLRTGNGQLNGSANGGPVNQPTNPATGSLPGAVDNVNYDWYQDGVPANNGNISANQVAINASEVNDPGTLVVTDSDKTTFEDQATWIGGDFVITDVESSAFGKPVTVTLTVGQGQLGIGGTANDSSLEINGVTIQGDNSGTLILTGTASAIQALLNDPTNGLTYKSALNANHDQNGAAAGDVTLNVHLDTSTASVGDTGGLPPADVQIALTITPVNDPPTITAPSDTILLDNNAPGGNNVDGFVIGDPDVADAGGIAAGENDIVQVTVRITDENGNPLSVSQYRDQQNSAITISSLNTTSGVFIQNTSQDGVTPPSNGQNAPLVITGTVAQINAYLAQLQVTMRGAILDDADQYFRVEVIVDDRVRDANGNLTSSANGGDNIGPGGVGTSQVPNTVISPYAAIPGGLGQNVASTYRTIFQSSVNDPAQIKLGENPVLNTDENSATVTLPPITISDSDAGSQSMTVTVKLPNGFVFVAPTGSGGTFTGAGTDTLTFNGSYTQINSYLAGLRVTLPDADGSATAADWNGNFSVKVTVNDHGNSGSRPGSLPGSGNDPHQDPGQVEYEEGDDPSALITTREFTFTVNAVNDAPEVVGTPSVTIPTLEEDTLGSSLAGSNIHDLFFDFFNDERDTINNDGTVGVGGGSSADSFYGVAITSHTPNTAQGDWQYSLDGGTSWQNVGARSDSNALVLTASASLRFVPAANYFGDPVTLGVRLVETNANGDVSSTPALPDNGEQINIDATGGHGGTSIYSETVITLSTEVTNINDRPTLGDTTVTIAEDTPTPQTIGQIFQSVYGDATDNQTAIAGGGNASGALGFIAIYGDDTDASKGHWEYSTDGSNWLTIPSDVSASNALVLASTTQLRFVPLGDYNGPVSGGLQLRASDTTDTSSSGAGVTNGRVNFFDFAKDGDQTSHWSNTARLSVTVTPVTDAANDSFTTHANVPLVNNTSDLLLNDTFSNSDKTVTAVTQPSHGTLTLVNNVLTYTPDTGYVGSDSYTYTVVSGGITETATVTINVTNQAPTGVTDNLSIDEDSPLTLGNVLTNDSDPDGAVDTLTVKNFTVEGNTYAAGTTVKLTGSHGTLLINADGSYLYTPGGDWHGDIAVSYVVSDGNMGGDSSAVLGIHVAAVDDAKNDVEIEHTGTVITTDVLGNDTFSNIDQAVTSFTQPQHGTVTLGPNNKLIYTPDAGFVGSDRYNYTVTSGGVTETATVFIFMTNTPPDASNQFAVTDEDTPASGDVLHLIIDPDGDPLHVVDFQIDGISGTFAAGQKVTIAGKGDFTLNTDGSYLFTPVPDWNGKVPTITFHVSDNTSVPPTESSLDITVRPMVDITHDTATTHAGTPVTIDVLANDHFSNSDAAIQQTVFSAAHGTVTLVGNKLVYTPNAGYVGDDVFTYTVKSGGIEETASVTVTMTNTLPEPRNSVVRTPEDTTITNGDLLDGARDADSDTLTVTNFTIDGVVYAADESVEIEGKGTLTIHSDGLYTFVPVPDWNGQVPPVTFTVSDGNNGGQVTRNLVIIVQPVADILPDNATTHADNPVAIDVLHNDSFSNDTKTVTASSDGTTLGRVEVLSNNTIRYTPPPGFVGTDTFSYSVTSGGITETSTVTVVVTNTAPTARDMELTMDEDGTSLSGLLTASDVDSDVVRVTSFHVDGISDDFLIGNFGTTSAIIPGVGTFTLSYDRHYTFTPLADWNGDVPKITYTVTDDNGGATAVGHVDITVNPVVDIADDTATLHAGGSSTINVLANDNFENDDRAVTLVGAAQNGTVTIGTNGNVTYTPSPEFVGTDSYTYTVTSGGVTETATVFVTVENTAPIANPDTQTVNEDSTITGNVLDNDRDPDNSTSVQDTLRVTSFTLPGESVAHLVGEAVTISGIGELTLNADGSYQFVPVGDWNGSIPLITYQISDGHTGGTASSTLTLEITAVDDIAPDSASTHAGQPVTIDVLSNDSFENGDREITTTSSGAHGSATIVDGKIVYTPLAGFVGSDSFTYTVTSGGKLETTTVTVQITNSAPLANPDINTTPEDTVARGNVLTNDTDADPDDAAALHVTRFTIDGNVYAPGSVVTLSGMGVLTLRANGNWTFVPVADWNGTLPVVSYDMSDGNDGGVSSSSLSITIAPVQDAFNDLISVNGNSSVTSDVLANDTFSNNDNAIVSISQGNHGTVSVENGKITYTPNLGYVGNDSYTYTVLSGGILETATVVVRVADLAPIVNPEAVITQENTPISGNLLTNDSDPNGDPLHISVFQVGGTRYNAGETALLAGIGSLTVQADGSYTFTPVNNWHGFVPAVTYTVSDGYAVGETNGTLRILVAPSVEIQVREDGLTPLDPGAQEVSGTLDLLSLDKLKTFTFQGRVITAEQLLQLNPLSPITIETVTGTITLLAYYSAADGEGHLDYRFVLREAVAQPGQISTHNDYAVEVNGVNVGQLRITVVNDQPTATDDSAEILQDQGQQNVSGNLFNDDRIGADRAADNGPVTGVMSENTGAAGTIGGTSSGQYGTLFLDSQGNWRYQVNSADPRVAALDANATLSEVFVYTITDSDGDTSEARLTIRIYGVTAMPNDNNDRDGEQIFGRDDDELLTPYRQSYQPGLFILPLVYDLQSDATGLQTRLNSQFAAIGYGIEQASSPVMQQAVLFSRWYNDSREQRDLPGLASNGLGQNSLGNSFGPFGIGQDSERSATPPIAMAQERPALERSAGEQPSVITLGAQPLSAQLAALERKTLASGKHITVPTITRR